MGLVDALHLGDGRGSLALVTVALVAPTLVALALLAPAVVALVAMVELDFGTKQPGGHAERDAGDDAVVAAAGLSGRGHGQGRGGDDGCGCGGGDDLAEHGRFLCLRVDGVCR